MLKKPLMETHRFIRRSEKRNMVLHLIYAVQEDVSV